MQKRIGLSQDRIKVVYNGLNLEGFQVSRSEAASETSEGPSVEAKKGSPRPVLGYLARMCQEKGLDTLVEAFIEVRRRARVPGLQLCVVGSLGPADVPFVTGLRDRLAKAELHGQGSFHPNLDRPTQIKLLSSFNVLSVPALDG